MEQRFEVMESKISDLRDQIEAMKAEKNLLEKRIQIETEELNDRLQDRNLKIECLLCEKNDIQDELQQKNEELDKWKKVYNLINAQSEYAIDADNLRKKLDEKNLELEEKNEQIDQLTKELLIKTQNLQKLVNTELWSKNKEIAKLHNHMTSSQYQEKIRNKTDFTETATSQLNALIKELNDIGMQVTFTNDIIQLNFVNSDDTVDITMITDYIHKLIAQKNELEIEVDYLKWLKLISKPVNKIDICDSTTGGDKQYCELLRTHLKELVKFMNEMLRNTDQTTDVNSKQKKIVFDVLLNSKILSDEFMNALEELTCKNLDDDITIDKSNRINRFVRKSKSDNFVDCRHQFSTPSDSEAFSEPDRMVSFARMGLSDIKQKSINRLRTNEFVKTFSDSEDSVDYFPCHETCQNDTSDFDANQQIFELKEINNFIFSELNVLKNEVIKNIFDDEINKKLSIVFSKLETSKSHYEKLQNYLEKKIHECHSLKKESKQNSTRKIHLEKKILEVENMGLEIAKQNTEMLQCKNNTDIKPTEMLISSLNKENELLKAKVKKLEEENEETKIVILRRTKELDHLTLSHSQILVENTKLTNDKLRLEQEIRKTESRYDVIVRSLKDKFNKELIDLNKINELHLTKRQEFEETNRELRRHMIVCETDSAPSSSGISSALVVGSRKQICDITSEYNMYNGSQYWLSTPSSTRSKSSCSPDLGIESDTAVTSIRPLRDTLKITQSMTNLLSDDNCNNNQRPQAIYDSDVLPVEGFDEIHTLKQENVALKRRLMKTRRALEDTFQHLSTSNKNKKNVEKAITKQLMITKNILKKTRNYEDWHYEN